ncbi:hypothetical protein FGG08_002027 [Glutinoglossum americanum]|uniref:polynucleotide adenylyltransferase n=1 Tax=Glutinoglossum americanum TaxID=1670608 RepID=A0A9P8IAH7_9PEZI|nr:hypothetical protein FGG08_002027 [Glutinoglossum americanum]
MALVAQLLVPISLELQTAARPSTLASTELAKHVFIPDDSYGEEELAYIINHAFYQAPCENFLSDLAMEGHRIPHGSSSVEYPGGPDDIQQPSWGLPNPPYPQYLVVPSALTSTAPPLVSSREYPTSNGGGVARYDRNSFLGSNFSAFLEQHRNFALAHERAPELNPAELVSTHRYRDPPAPIQNVPPGYYSNHLSFLGNNHSGIDHNDSSSSFNPSLYNTGHYPYHGTPSFGQHGVTGVDEHEPTSPEVGRHPVFGDYGPPRPPYPNYMASSGPIDRPIPVLMSPFHGGGPPSGGRWSSSDEGGTQAGFHSHGSFSSAPQGYGNCESVIPNQIKPALHPALGQNKTAQCPTSSPHNPQNQINTQSHYQETAGQQLASAIRMGIDFNTYQKLYGKPIGDPESKESKLLPSLNSPGPTTNHGLVFREPPKDVDNGRASASTRRLGSGVIMTAKDLGGGSEDVEGRLGSLMIDQEANRPANTLNEANEARPAQLRPHPHDTSVNKQKSSLASWPSIEARDSSAEGKPLEASKPATGSGPNPATSARRRPNQAQRRQSRLQSEFLVAASPATVVVPQSPRRQYSNNKKCSRQQPPPPLALANPQGQNHHKPNFVHHSVNQRHPQVDAREQQQMLLQTQQAHFNKAGIAHQAQSFQRKPQDNIDLHQPTMPVQTGPRQQQLHQQRGPGRFPMSLEETINIQSDYLAGVARAEVAKAEVDYQEMAEKELFRSRLEAICRDVIGQHEASIPDGDAFDPNTIRLECFGSLSSGFATKASDMDLVLLSPLSCPPLSSSNSPIPRLLEKRLLELGFGARFLTKTRVPIMKLCEKPTEELLGLLKKARGKWEAGEDHMAMGEKDTDNTLAFSPSRDLGRIQQMSLYDNEDATTPTLQDDPNPRDSSEPKSPTHSLKQLEQKPKETLWAYNSRARKILKLVGGRDVTLRHENLQSADLKRLAIAAEGFVNGIREEALRNVVKAALPKNFVPSLYGVWLLAEGEQLIKSWETRKIHELTGEKETRGYKLIREWRQLQDREVMVPAHYNEEIRKLLEQMQQLPSLRLLSLTQRPDEPTEMYSTRATAVLEELGGIDCDSGNWEDELSPTQRTLLELTIRQYIDGIHDPALRKEVRRTSSRRNVSLADLSSIHLAEASIQKYESGISMGLYTSQEQETLKEHGQLVRLYGLKSGREDVRTILEKMKSIPDPYPLPKQRDFTDALEFPKSGIGIQCDINFSNLLALYNTALLRCYSLSDPRVRPMTIFVKAWAKKRKINSPYHGTLSSYGYVLMVLHYLLNIASPPVLTNLQHAWEFSEREFLLDGGLCGGYDVKFWCDEEEIKRLASLGQFTQNQQSLGALLRGFFEYYSHQGAHVTKNGFVWNLNTISIRTAGGLIPKHTKGWTEAKTVVVGGKEVRQRYLLAIEDPFETDHNVGRTVTYHGVSLIRDEFRRAWRIVNAVGKDYKFLEGLFDEVEEMKGRGEKPVRGGGATETGARSQE